MFNQHKTIGKNGTLSRKQRTRKTSDLPENHALGGGWK
jgi:hypothetical protein